MKFIKYSFALLILSIITSCSPKNQENSNFETKTEALASFTDTSTALADYGTPATSTTRIFTFKNEGDTAGPATPSLSDPSFSIILQSGCGTVNVGSTCTVRVSFNPTGKADGVYESTLTVGETTKVLTATKAASGTTTSGTTGGTTTGGTTTSGGGASSITASISGTPVVSPLDYGSFSGTQSSTKVIRLKNTGTISTGPHTATLSDSDFTFTLNGCSNKTLAPNGTCDVRVTFNASGKIAQLYESNLIFGSLTLPVQATVTGATTGGSTTGGTTTSGGTTGGTTSGGAATISFLDGTTAISSNPFVIGSTTTTSITKVIIIKNTGLVPATTATATLTGTDLTFALNSCSNKTLAPNGSCTVRVTFNPAGKIAGDFTSTLAFGANSLPLKATKNSTGTTTTSTTTTGSGSPNLVADLALINFGNLLDNGTAIDKIVKITNSGTANSSALATTIPTNYSQVIDGCSNTILAPSSFCTVRIRFAPTGKSIGSYNANLIVSSLSIPIVTQVYSSSNLPGYSLFGTPTIIGDNFSFVGRTSDIVSSFNLGSVHLQIISGNLSCSVSAQALPGDGKDFEILLTNCLGTGTAHLVLDQGFYISAVTGLVSEEKLSDLLNIDKQSPSILISNFTITPSPPVSGNYIKQSSVTEVTISSNEDSTLDNSKITVSYVDNLGNANSNVSCTVSISNLSTTSRKVTLTNCTYPNLNDIGRVQIVTQAGFAIDLSGNSSALTTQSAVAVVVNAPPTATISMNGVSSIGSTEEKVIRLNKATGVTVPSIKPFDESKITLSYTGDVSCQKTVSTDVHNQYQDLTLSNCSGSGTVTVNLLSGYIQDIAGNISSSTSSSSIVVFPGALGPNGEPVVQISALSISTNPVGCNCIRNSSVVEAIITVSGPLAVLDDSKIKLTKLGDPNVTCDMNITASTVMSRKVTLTNCTYPNADDQGLFQITTESGFAVREDKASLPVEHPGFVALVSTISPTLSISMNGVTSIIEGESKTIRLNKVTGVTGISNLFDESKITLSYTGDASCQKTLSTDVNNQYQDLTLLNCLGTGSVIVNLQAGYLSDLSGNISSLLSSSSISVSSYPKITIVEPSSIIVKNETESFDFLVNAENYNSIDNSKVIKQALGSADCTMTVSTTAVSGQRKINFTNCLGTGTVGFSLAAGYAVNSIGDSILKNSNSLIFDNVGPSVSISSLTISTNPVGGNYVRNSSVVEATVTVLDTTAIIDISKIELTKPANQSVNCSLSITTLTSTTKKVTLTNCTYPNSDDQGRFQITAKRGYAKSVDNKFSNFNSHGGFLAVVSTIPPTLTISMNGVTSIGGTQSKTIRLNKATGFTAPSINPFDESKITLSYTGDATCQKSVITDNNNLYQDLTLSSCSGNGSVIVNLQAGYLSDLAGNTSSLLSSSSISVTNNPVNFEILQFPSTGGISMGSPAGAPMVIIGTCDYFASNPNIELKIPADQRTINSDLIHQIPCNPNGTINHALAFATHPNLKPGLATYNFIFTLTNPVGNTKVVSTAGRLTIPDPSITISNPVADTAYSSLGAPNIPINVVCNNNSADSIAPGNVTFGAGDILNGDPYVYGGSFGGASAINCSQTGTSKYYIGCPVSGSCPGHVGSFTAAGKGDGYYNFYITAINNYKIKDFKIRVIQSSQDYTPISVILSSDKPLDYISYTLNNVTTPSLGGSTYSGSGTAPTLGGSTSFTTTGGSSSTAGVSSSNSANSTSTQGSLAYDITSLSDLITFTTSVTFPLGISSGSCALTNDSPLANRLGNNVCNIGANSFTAIRDDATWSSGPSSPLKVKITSAIPGNQTTHSKISNALFANRYNLRKIIDMSGNSTTTDEILSSTMFNNQLYFVYRDSASVSKLYYVNSSYQATQVTNLRGNNSLSDNIGLFAIMNNELYFTGYNSSSSGGGNNFQKLFKINTSNSITQVSNTRNSQTASDFTVNNIVANGSLYFSASNSNSFNKLYKYTGTTLSQFSNWTNNQSSHDPIGNAYSFSSVSFNGFLYTAFNDRTSASCCTKLFKVNYSTGAATRVSNLRDNYEQPNYLLTLNGNLYFTAYGGNASIGVEKIYKINTSDQVTQVTNFSGDQLTTDSIDNGLYKDKINSEILFVATVSGIKKLYKINNAGTVSVVANTSGSSSTTDDVQILGLKNSGFELNLPNSEEEDTSYSGVMYFLAKNSLGAKKLYKYEGGVVTQLSNISGDQSVSDTISVFGIHRSAFDDEFYFSNHVTNESFKYDNLSGKISLIHNESLYSLGKDRVNNKIYFMNQKNKIFVLTK